MSPRIRCLPLCLAFLAAGLFIATPSLCVAGVIEHACDCEEAGHACDCEETDDTEASGSHIGGTHADGDRDTCEDGCSHDGCANDPCESLSVLKTGSRSAAGVDLAPQVGGFLADAAALYPQGGPFSGRGPARYSSAGPPGVGRVLPCHPSDLPLLL